MCKLHTSLVAALTSMASANICADGIALVDKKNALPIDSVRFSEDLKVYTGLKSGTPYRLYVDGVTVDLINSDTVSHQCNYTITIGLDNSLRVTTSNPAGCTPSQYLRAAAPPYKLAGLYTRDDVVSFTDTEKSATGLYKCFNAQMCGIEGYGPEQVHGDDAWVLLSKRYVTPKKKNCTQNGITYRLAFVDHKHSAYLENSAQELPLKATLISGKDGSGYINFYVDNALIFLTLRNIIGKDCDYKVTLNADNSIFVKSGGNGCTQGYVREPSGPYTSGVSYKRGDIVIEKNNKTHVNDYYQCVISHLCGLSGYAPKGPNGHLAWSLVHSNMLFPKCR